MKNSWNKVVAMILAAALCVSCGVTGFAEDTQTDENTEIVEMVEQQNQEEPPKEEAPEPVQEPEPAPVQEEPKEEPAPAPVKEEPKAEPAPEAPKAEPAPEAPKAEEPKAEPAPAPVTEEPKAEPAPEAPKAEEPKAEEPKKAEETKAEEPKAEEPKAEESQTEEPKPEEKLVEQPTVPVTKVELPAEEAPAADEVKKENITVCIEWEDEDNAIGLRPQTLAVTLSGSDGQIYSAKIAEKDGWQHTFADLTTQRGRLNPEWWSSGCTQYGKLLILELSETGCLLNGTPVPNLTIHQFHFSANAPITIRIGNKPDAEYPGGFNIFGKKFGDFEQDIVLSITYASES